MVNIFVRKYTYILYIIFTVLFIDMTIFKNFRSYDRSGTSYKMNIITPKVSFSSDNNYVRISNYQILLKYPVADISIILSKPEIVMAFVLSWHFNPIRSTKLDGHNLPLFRIAQGFAANTPSNTAANCCDNEESKSLEPNREWRLCLTHHCYRLAEKVREVIVGLLAHNNSHSCLFVDLLFCGEYLWILTLWVKYNCHKCINIHVDLVRSELSFSSW